MTFWIVFAQKGKSPGKRKKWTVPLSSVYPISRASKAQFKLTILWAKFSQRKFICWIKTRQVYPSLISACSNYCPKRAFFGMKQKKADINTELCIFELVYAPNFTLNGHFWIFGTDLPKKSISSRRVILLQFKLC